MRMPSSGSYSRLDDEAALASLGHGRRGATLDLRNLWLILRWRARFIGFVALALVAVVTCVLVLLPPKYKATTIVLVDPRQPRVTKTEAVLSGIGADAAAVESQVELITSSALADKVIGRLRLANDPDFTSPSLSEQISDAVVRLVGGDRGGLEKTRTGRLIYRFQRNLVVRRRGLTYVIEISYFAKDPDRAAEIANAVAEAYIDDQRAGKATMTAQASGWLGDRIEEMRDRVRRSEEAVEAYRSAHNIVNVTQGNKLINRQIEDLTQQIALTRSRTADARARLERVQQAARRKNDPATLNEALQSQVIANLRSQYAEAARIEAEYGALYGVRHPAVIAVRAQLVDVRRQIDAEIARILEGVRNEYETALSRSAALENELVKLKEQFATLSEADVKLRELEREAQANRTLFEQFLGRVKETSEQQSLQIADARIVSPALPPLKPDRPGTLLLLAVGACGGLILGIGIVLVREEMRQGFRSLHEITQYVSLPGIGILPHGTGNGSGVQSWITSVPTLRRAKMQASSRIAVNPHSAYARNLCAIRAHLLPSAAKPEDKIIVVVSALPGEGKSTFACNFALAAASSGMRTLLIDGDVHTAAITRTFGLNNPGLAEVMDGKILFWDAVLKDAKGRLHVLGARGPRAGHGKAIDPARLAALLGEYGNYFNLVVIDSPAILSVGGSLPHLECADRAILLVEWDRTERQALSEALIMLGPNARKLSGVVLNKVSVGWYRLFDYGGYLNSDDDAREAA